MIDLPPLDSILTALESRIGPSPHWHCVHPYEGVLGMVVPDGHVVLKCCKCDHMETQHRAHLASHGGVRR